MLIQQNLENNYSQQGNDNIPTCKEARGKATNIHKIIISQTSKNSVKCFFPSS